MNITRRAKSKLVHLGVLVFMVTIVFHYLEHVRPFNSVFGKLWGGDLCSLLGKNELATMDDRLTDVTEIGYIAEWSIFFHETSCSKDVTARQACAVEAAARTDPKTQIYLLLTSQTANLGPKGGRYLLVLSTNYPNINIHRLHIGKYVRNTPMEDWFRSAALHKSHWIMEHSSDALRYLTLWKYGGSYVDLDVILLRSLAGMKNFAGAEGSEDVAAGVINFEGGGSLGREGDVGIDQGPTGGRTSEDAATSGHRLAWECVQEFVSGYRGDDWGHNGPGVITRVLNRNCLTGGGGEDGGGRWRNCTGGFKVYPPSAFYPISYREWMKYFSENDTAETMEIADNAIAVHVWNKLSSEVVVKVGSQQPYSLLAAKYCPVVYSSCGDSL